MKNYQTLARFAGVITIIILIFVGYQFLFSHSKPKMDTQANKPSNKITVEGFIIQADKLSNNVVSSGTLIANEEAELKAEITGRITGIYFNEGEIVAAGKLLVKLYDGDLQAQLKKLAVQKQIKDKTLIRQKMLLKSEGISQQEVDVTASEADAILADMEVVKSQIVKTEIRAPFFGKIGFKNLSAGTVVSPAQVITTLQQTSPLKVDFSIPEKYSLDLKIGTPIRFTTEILRDTLQAVIYALESQIDLNTRSQKIRARYDNSATALSPGTFAYVLVPLKTEDFALMIPPQAIIPQTRGKKVVVSRNGKATFVNVETGLRTENKIQIIKGLNKGDTIITKGVMFVKPDMELTFSKFVK